MKNIEIFYDLRISFAFFLSSFFSFAKFLTYSYKKYCRISMLFFYYWISHHLLICYISHCLQCSCFTLSLSWQYDYKHAHVTTTTTTEHKRRKKKRRKRNHFLSNILKNSRIILSDYHSNLWTIEGTSLYPINNTLKKTGNRHKH